MINHLFWGTPISGNHHMVVWLSPKIFMSEEVPGAWSLLLKGYQSLTSALKVGRGGPPKMLEILGQLSFSGCSTHWFLVDFKWFHGDSIGKPWKKHWLLKLLFYHPASKHSNGTWTTHRLFSYCNFHSQGIWDIFGGFHGDFMGLNVHVRAKLKLCQFLVDGWLTRLEDYTTLYVLFCLTIFGFGIPIWTTNISWKTIPVLLTQDKEMGNVDPNKLRWRKTWWILWYDLGKL